MNAELLSQLSDCSIAFEPCDARAGPRKHCVKSKTLTGREIARWCHQRGQRDRSLSRPAMTVVDQAAVALRLAQWPVLLLAPLLPALRCEAVCGANAPPRTVMIQRGNDAEFETRVNFLGGHKAPPDLQGAKVLMSRAWHLAFLERLAPAQLAPGFSWLAFGYSLANTNSGRTAAELFRFGRRTWCKLERQRRDGTYHQ